MQMSGDGLVAERIEDPAFGAHGGSLYLLAGMAGNENKRRAQGPCSEGDSLSCPGFSCYDEAACQFFGSPFTSEMEINVSPSANWNRGRLVVPGATASSRTRRRPAASARVVAGPP